MYKIELDDYGCLIVSEGILNPEYLIPEFLSFLSDYAEDKAEEKEINGYYKEYEEMIEKGDYEGIAEMYDFLYDMMGELSPDGVYFGGAEGDPACIGFWMVEENDF